MTLPKYKLISNVLGLKFATYYKVVANFSPKTFEISLYFGKVILLQKKFSKEVLYHIVISGRKIERFSPSSVKITKCFVIYKIMNPGIFSFQSIFLIFHRTEY